MESKFASILLLMAEARAKFILVGGVAAVIQGAPIHTYSVDIVFSQEAGNVTRLSKVMNSLDAVFRMQLERPNASHLMGDGHLNLLTKHGPLDLLTFLGDGLRYDELLKSSRRMRINASTEIDVLDLEILIALKAKLGGDKDLAALPTLRATLQQRKNKE